MRSGDEGGPGKSPLRVINYPPPHPTPEEREEAHRTPGTLPPDVQYSQKPHDPSGPPCTM